jgi:Fe-S cluster assembly protein SufD
MNTMKTHVSHPMVPAGFVNAAESLANLHGSSQESLIALREKALSDFTRQGIPNKRHEEWKYLDLSSLASTSFVVAGPLDQYAVDATSAEQFRLIGGSSCMFIVENGSLNESASHSDKLPAGIRVGTFAELGSDKRVIDHLLRHADTSDEPLVALNAALSYNPVIVLVDKNMRIDVSVQFAFVSVAGDVPSAINSRLLIVLDENSECTITETHHTFGTGKEVFVNAVTETVIAPNAKLHHVKVQNESTDTRHISYHKVNLAQDSSQHLTTLTLGGGMVRNTLNIRLDGQQVNTWLNGLYVLNGVQVVDNHTLVDHAMPHCFSSELYKGIIDDKAQGVFNGKIWVRPDAQKTNAYQSNKNLLLSNEASMNTKPQLEIYADDVKCSHGTTTGQLDDDALFYLRARGIGEATARALLNHAFAADVIEQVENEEIRNSLLTILDQTLNSEGN